MPKEFNGDVELLTGTAHPILSYKIGEILGKTVHQAVKERFADGEPHIQIPVNVRNKDVYIIQPTCPPNVAQNKVDLTLIINAAKLASAREITAVTPYFGYARQDRKARPRTPISAKVAAQDIERAGASRIITVDIHNEAVQGFVNIPWDFLYASYGLIPAIEQLALRDIVIASPDIGGFKGAFAYAKRLKATGVAAVFKERDLSLANKSEALDMIGDVKDKDVIIRDDMIDTGGTLVNAARLIKERGARSVRAAITHGLFSGPALEKISDSPIEQLFVTNSIPLRTEVIKHPKIEEVDIAPLLALAIRYTHTGESISEKLL